MEKELKTSERGKILLVRDRATKLRYIYREFPGNGEVYRKMQGIECPYLPKIEAVEESNDRVFVVEEYIQGDTLAFILKGGALDEKLAERVTIQICRALEALHSLGVVHRDIKPENIILRGDDAVLIDFDASRLCKEKRNSDTQVMGTAGYAAPEQYGFSQTDARADIYALGVLLNEMLIRQHPAKQLAAGKYLPIIERCIEVNMDKRYRTATELRCALETSGLTAPTQRRKTRKGILIAALAIFLLAGSIYGINHISSGSEPQGGDTIQQEPPPYVETSTPITEPTISKEPTVSEAPTPPASEITLLQQSLHSWPGDSEVYGTRFQYDLDGDGETETYIFAGMYNFIGEPRVLQSSASDITQRPEILEVAPAVWRQTDFETYEIVEEFAPLLSGATVTLLQKEGTHEGIFEPISDLHGVWSGSFRGTFQHEGLWYYVFTAELSGETLSAVGIQKTTVESQLPEKNHPDADDTPVESQPPEQNHSDADDTPTESQPLEQNHPDSYYTLFQYDLDGDGTKEEYLFGGIFYRGDRSFGFSEDKVALPASVKYTNNRYTAPGVWQKTSSGSYEPVEAFASLLADAKVTFSCLEGDSQPEIWQESELLAPWSGAIRVKYTQNGIWRYDFSAKLAGQELTAAEITTTTRIE